MLVRNTRLEFISKSTLMFSDNSKITNDKLSRLFEEILDKFYYTGAIYCYIDCVQETLSKSNSIEQTYLKCVIGGKEFPEFKVNMDINTYHRFCEIIKNYGVFYQNENPSWEHGLIVTTKVNDRNYPRRIYSFLTIITPTNLNLVNTISIQAIDRAQVLNLPT